MARQWVTQTLKTVTEVDMGTTHKGHKEQSVIFPCLYPVLCSPGGRTSAPATHALVSLQNLLMSPRVQSPKTSHSTAHSAGICHVLLQVYRNLIGIEQTILNL